LLNFKKFTVAAVVGEATVMVLNKLSV